VASLKPEYIVSFIHTTGAKVKAGDGKFSFTVGTSVDRELLTKLEEASDGIVELKISESEKEPRRRLAIRKFRGRKHSTEWIDFQVTEHKGIVFQIHRKTLRKLWKGS
jgi:KaiC/GvpD/RAD55 family RecA-like ATPase